MNGGVSLKFKRGDAAAVAVVLLCAPLLSFTLFAQVPATEHTVVQVCQNGQIICELPLERDGSYTVSGQYVNVITVQNGQAAITRSDCPGEDCVHSGWISSPGRSVVCLPNRVELRLTGSSGVDASAG